MKVFLDEEFKNWILDAVIRESLKYTEEKIEVVYITTSRRKNIKLFLSLKFRNQIRIDEGDLVVNHRTLNYLIETKLIKIQDLPKIRCHFTHESQESLLHSRTLSNLGKIMEVLVLNRKDKQVLSNLNIDSNKIKIIYGAIDRNIFYPSNALPIHKYVLITGDAKGRKNPGKIVQLIARTPEIDFIICGKGWNNFFDIEKFGNLKIFEFELNLNAKLMREASSYLTLSLEEGGPYPVLEALASGTPVVSTPVGWVPEIVDSANGIILSNEADFKEIERALRITMNMKARIFTMDLLEGRYTWKEQAKLLFTWQNHGNRIEE